MGRSSACADAYGSCFDEENTVPAGGRAAERPWNRIHSANKAAQRDLPVNQLFWFNRTSGGRYGGLAVNFGGLARLSKSWTPRTADKRQNCAALQRRVRNTLWHPREPLFLIQVYFFAGLLNGMILF